jgi:hypothetical protein
MSKLLKRPSASLPTEIKGRYEKFNLYENPFPSNPFVDKNSEDKRINGAIYEIDIRTKEYDQIESVFLRQPQSDLNHLRLGYIVDESYIGRGNGKSAFLVHLQQVINAEYCLDVSEGQNKCFAVYMSPEAGGRNKTFTSFVDLIFSAILRENIVRDCLAILRLEAINELGSANDLPEDEEEIKINLNDREWFKAQSIEIDKVNERVLKNDFLQTLPPRFPLFRGRNSLLTHFITQFDFEDYYLNELKKGKERFDFVFSDLINFFLAAGFNGAYLLIDNFELIPDFQSARQKRDFALELRSCLFDGMYVNARLGFYNCFLVLHAGVQRLISEAWATSGMESRSPITPQVAAKHIVSFGKLSPEHAALLLKKYLSVYRIKPQPTQDSLFPFTEKAISRIGELSEYNAAKILKMAYELLERAAEIDGPVEINEKFLLDSKVVQEASTEKGVQSIEDVDSVDLLKKAREE